MPKITKKDKLDTDSDDSKQELEKTLDTLNDYLESCDRSVQKCGTTGCAVCIRAARKACDAPILKELINRVILSLPENITFPCPCPPSPSFPSILDLRTQNLFVALPCDDDCGERRIVLPFIDIIRRLFVLLPTYDSGAFNTVSIVLNLNILVNGKLVIDPFQFNPVQNVDNIVDDPCACDQYGAIQFSIALQVTNANLSGLVDGTGFAPIGTINVLGPNGGVGPTEILGTFSGGILTNISIGIFGSPPSRGLYLSFVPSCTDNSKKCSNKIWIMTNLATQLL